MSYDGAKKKMAIFQKLLFETFVNIFGTVIRNKFFSDKHFMLIVSALSSQTFKSQRCLIRVKLVLSGFTIAFKEQKVDKNFVHNLLQVIVYSPDNFISTIKLAMKNGCFETETFAGNEGNEAT